MFIYAIFCTFSKDFKDVEGLLVNKFWHHEMAINREFNGLIARLKQGVKIQIV